MKRLPLRTIAWLVLAGAAACRAHPSEDAPRAPAALSAPSDFEGTPPPPDSTIPDGPIGASIRRGQAILFATRDSLPAHVGDALRCVSCHLDGGRRTNGSWVGVYGRYPQYRSRSGTVVTIEDRVNGCFRRSMNGSPLPPDGPDMRDIVSYLWFLSWGTPVGSQAATGSRRERFAHLEADTAAGRVTFDSVCSVCHGKTGEGTPAAPPLWGPRSFNIGAGMARVRTAAAFIRDNMPFNDPGSLTDQQAFDVASFVVARPRPDLPGKEYDWPNGDPPPDVAYPTLAASPKAAAGKQSP
ncbi:MAG: c-type cytochrome [Gemmatimonadetes bacterium]|nr:c-type cytochrome [Gemmatimonadota bacterium]